MIVRATSDLHLSQHSAGYVFAALDQLRQDAETNPGATVLCGDIFHQAETVHMPTWNRLHDLLHAWPDEMYVIVGNHDQYGARGRHCLEGMVGLPGVRIVDSPRWTALGRMLPYCAPDDFAPSLAGVAVPGTGAQAPPIVWCHHGFKGAYQNAMVQDSDGVSCAEVPPGHLIVTGHYHMPQTLGRIIYCGSPYQTTFAEEGQEKGWLRWADITANPMPIRIAYDLPSPRHWTIAWDPSTGQGPVKPAGSVEGDRFRIRTTAPKHTVRASSAQLKGLEGVPVITGPSTGPTRVGSTAPQTAAAEWVDLTAQADSGRALPAPMTDFAKEAGLFDG
jgi:hypothetical protein